MTILAKIGLLPAKTRLKRMFAGQNYFCQIVSSVFTAEKTVFSTFRQKPANPAHTTYYIISETSFSRQSLALVLTLTQNKEKKMPPKHKINSK